MIPERAGPYGDPDPMTQPPLLSWAVTANFRATRDRDRLAWALPRLELAAEWNLQHRDSNSNHLLEWLIEEDEQCRSGESGMDNSPRFDEALTLDAVDFSAYTAFDLSMLAGIAQELGEASRADKWLDRSRQVSAAIHRLLWDETRRFYYDRTMSGGLSSVTAVSGLVPLLLDDLPPSRAVELAVALADPDRFGSSAPVPSVVLSDPSWSTDMWRGASWVPMNFLIICGLRRHERTEEAERLRRQTIEMVSKYYERYGVLFEFFDSSDARPPTECDRKGPLSGPYDVRDNHGSVRDLHWTAALTACLILDELPSTQPLG
jgi:neutral trehalase